MEKNPIAKLALHQPHGKRIQAVQEEDGQNGIVCKWISYKGQVLNL
jgi:hypothetical protein